MRFDFNPLNLRSASNRIGLDFADLTRNPRTSPDTIDVLAPDLAKATSLATRIAEAPEVAETRTLQSFVPTDQDDKLAVIQDANFFLQNTLNPQSAAPAPTDAEDVAAMKTTAQGLLDSIGDVGGKTADDARRLSRLLTSLADGPPSPRQIIRTAPVDPLKITLDQVRSSLNAAPVTIAGLPRLLVQDWVARDGRARIDSRAEGEFERQYHDDAPLRQCSPRGRARGDGRANLRSRSYKTVVRAFAAGRPLADRFHRDPVVHQRAGSWMWR